MAAVAWLVSKIKPFDARLRSGDRSTLAQDAADKALSVEHVADQPAIGAEADRIARARDLRVGRGFGEQSHRGSAWLPVGLKRR